MKYSFMKLFNCFLLLLPVFFCSCTPSYTSVTPSLNSVEQICKEWYDSHQEWDNNDITREDNRVSFTAFWLDTIMNSSGLFDDCSFKIKNVKKVNNKYAVHLSYYNQNREPEMEYVFGGRYSDIYFDIICLLPLDYCVSNLVEDKLCSFRGSFKDIILAAQYKYKWFKYTDRMAYSAVIDWHSDFQIKSKIDVTLGTMLFDGDTILLTQY